MRNRPSQRLCGFCKLLVPISLSVALAMVQAPRAAGVLVQPQNYLLDDSPLTNQHEAAGSLSPYLNDGAEQQADKDIVSIIGDSLARLRFARMLDHQAQHEQDQQGQAAAAGQLSQEMAELLRESHEANKEAEQQHQAASLSSSVASMLMNVAQAAAASASSSADEQPGEQAPAGQMNARGQIMELDTSQAQGSAAAAQPSKSDLKTSGPIQWYNPKETIPVLKISSMATPSKYKKVYFRSEKKLVDGAFHSPSGTESVAEQAGKKSSLVKSFGQAAGANVQRRSSRGSASNAPPSVLQDGVIDFLKKFRDVYVQTRPAGQSGGAASPVSSPLNFASSVMSAAASSPLASFLAPPSGGRPNLMGALSTASQMVNSAAMLSQAAASGSPASSGSSAGAGSAAGTATATGAAAATAAAANANKAPLSAQSYVSFWSKTFPTWVRKMLKQMRRRSLYNSSKRQQHHHHHHHNHHGAAGVSQKIASGAVSSVVSDSTGGSSSGSSS